MKRLALMAFAALLAAGSAFAVPWFVYENEEAVKNGPWSFAEGTFDGLLVPADEALPKGGAFFIGSPEGLLFTSRLSRLDNEINAALLKPDQAVEDEGLTAAHEARAARLRGFLSPPQTSPSSIPGALSDVPLPVVNRTYEVKINGESVGSDAIVLTEKFNESDFDIEVVNVSTQSLWRVEFQLEANPKLSFMKKGQEKGLNRVPRRVLKYGYQAMFKPLKQGDSFTVPVRAFYIKKKNFEFVLTLESKDGGVEIKRFPVSFEPKPKE